MDTNKKRILLSTSIVASMAVLTFAFVWQGGSKDQVAVSVNPTSRGQRQVDDTKESRREKPVDEHEIEPTRKIRNDGKHKPHGGRKIRPNKGGPIRVIRNQDVPVL